MAKAKIKTIRGVLIIYSPAGVRSEVVITTANGPSLDQLKTAVGGGMERVKVRYEGRVRDAYVNEEGVLQNLPENDVGTAMLYGPWRIHTIAGPIAIWVPT